MHIYETAMKRRTTRKFTQTPLPEQALLKLIDCARMTAYGANMQPLKFGIITEQNMLDEIFPQTKWAAYLEDGSPQKGERPTAYIAIFADHRIKNGDCSVEAGAAGAVISLAAEEMGIGTCILGALQFDKLSALFGLSEEMELIQLIALGYPAQKCQAVTIKDSVKYYMNEDNVLCVPKRSMEEVLLFYKK